MKFSRRSKAESPNALTAGKALRGGGLRRHGLFALIWILGAIASTVYLARFYPYDLSVDEFQAFDQARHFLATGTFNAQGAGRSMLLGLPRGATLVLMDAATMKAFGVSEAAARFPALLAALGCVALAYAGVFRLTRRRAPAALTALALFCVPEFFEYAFACRMYSFIVFFQLASVFLFFTGLEARARRAGGILRREGVRVTPLILGSLIFLLNLDQHIALGLCVFAVGTYGLILCAANLCALLMRRVTPGFKSALARRFYLKYALLALMQIVLVGLLARYALTGAWPQTGLAIFDQVPNFLYGQFDLHFTQHNVHLWRMFFPGAWGLCALPLIATGAWGFARTARARRFGVFLLVLYAFLMATAIFAWGRADARYALFMLAMHAPLLGMGAWTLARAAARGLTRARPAATACIGVALLLLPYVGDLASGRYAAEARAKPFGEVEYRQAYGYILAHAQAGDALGLQYPRDYYLSEAARAEGKPLDALAQFDLFSRCVFRLRDLADVMRTHPRGWLAWATTNERHISPHLLAIIQTHLTAHRVAAHGTMRAFSWDADQAAQVIALVPVAFEQILIVSLGGAAQNDQAYARQILDENAVQDLPLSEYVDAQTRIQYLRVGDPAQCQEDAAGALIHQHFKPAHPERCALSTFQFEGAPVLVIAQQR